MSVRCFFVVALIALLTGCSMSADLASTDKQVAQFHALLDAGQSRQIYEAASESLRKTVSEQDMQALLDAVHRKLGMVRSSTRGGWRVNANTSGTYVALSYKTHFSEGDATEQFTYRIDGGHAVLVGYHISSNALIEK